MKNNYNFKTRFAAFLSCFIMIYALGVKAQTVTLNAVLSGKVTSADVLTSGDETNICSTCDRGYIKFDLSSIPGGASITAATLKMVAIPTSTSSTSAANRITSTTADAATAGAGFYAAIASAPVAYTGSWSFAALPATFNMTINAAGITNLNTAIGTGQITYGVVRASTNVYTFGGYNNATTADQPQLVVTYAFPCSGTPTAGTASGPASICSGANFNLSLAGYTTGVPGITFQWQSSPDGIAPYVDITGATAATATVSETAGTFYQCVVTCTGSGLSAISTSVDVPLNAATYAAIPYTATFESTWVNGCDIQDIPDNSWRNTPVTGNDSWRRQDAGTTAAWSYLPSGIVTPSGSTGAADFHTYGASGGDTGTFDLYLNLSTTSPISLNFTYNNLTGTDSLQVLLSTDGGITFSAPKATYYTSTAWTPELINLGVINSATTVLRFEAFSDFGDDDIGIDNVNVDLSPSCIAPITLGASSITGTGATFTWTAGGTETNWDVYYGPSPLTAPTGATTPTASVITNSYNATGLTSLTSYQYYVRSNCGGTAGTSTWSGPYTFNTLCGGTTCGYIFDLRSSGGDGWNSASIDIMENGIIVQNVSMVTGSEDSISVPLCDGIVTSLVWHQGTFPEEISYTLYNPYGATINTFADGSLIAEDSVFSTFTTNCTPPACPQPMGLTVTNPGTDSAIVAWTCPTCTGPYIIEFDTAGFTPGTGILDTVPSSPYNLTGLMQGTNYQLYVSQDCSASASGVSTQAGPASFTTKAAYDNVCGAAPLSFGTNGPYNTTIGTTQTGEPTPPGTGCGTQSSWCNTLLTNSLWFTFIAPASGRVSIESPDFDTQLALWSALTCDTILHGGATLIAANDDDPNYMTDGGVQYSSMLNPVNCLTPGKKYYVQLDPYSSPGASTRIILTDLGAVDASFTAVSPDCIGSAPITLVPAQAGGVFSGAGVTGTTFDPTAAGVGTHAIVYKITSCDSTIQTIVVDSLPNASFTFGTGASTATFTNTSTGGLTNSWNFGDGSPVNTTTNPVHTYSANGTYNVELIVSNTCGADTIIHPVILVGSGIQENSWGGISVFPNPTNGQFNITSNASFNELMISIVDLQGKEVYNSYDKNVASGYSKQINLDGLSKGIYYIKLNTGSDIKIQKLIIQ